MDSEHGFTGVAEPLHVAPAAIRFATNISLIARIAATTVTTIG